MAAFYSVDDEAAFSKDIAPVQTISTIEDDHLEMFVYLFKG